MIIHVVWYDLSSHTTSDQVIDDVFIKEFVETFPDINFNIIELNICLFISVNNLIFSTKWIFAWKKDKLLRSRYSNEASKLVPFLNRSQVFQMKDLPGVSQFQTVSCLKKAI